MLALANKLSLTTQPIYRFVNKYSVQFDGSDQRIITDGADTVAQPTTYSFWCKSSETGVNNGVFGHGLDRTGAFHFNRNADRPQLFLGTNYYVFWNDNSAQDDGEWHHWVVYSDTNDITNSKLYVDGVLQSQSFVSSSGSLNAYTESLTIGSDQQLGGNSFEGKIDEFAVYDRELTQAEITKIYNDGSPINLNLNAGDYQSANPLITSTKSMEFDSTDDYLQLSEPFSYTNHTICAWIYSDVLGSDEIFSTGDTDSDGIRLLTRSLGNFRYRLNGVNNDSAAGTFEANKWYFVVGTYDGTTSNLYINGALSNSVTTSQTISTTTNATIGKNSWTNSQYFDGNITEVGAFNRCLTALEVASLYNQGMPTNLLVNRNNYQSGNPTVFNTKQVDFDGVDDYMIANSTLGSMTGSVSMWLKRDSNTTVDFLIEFRGLGGTGVGYIYINASTDVISISSGTVYVDGVSGNTISVGQWHHIVVTGMTIDITESILFGRQYPGAHYLDGDMSQVGLWNSTLTADEVSSLYNHGLPIDLTTDQAAYSSSSNLVGYWRMGSGTLDSYPLIADQTNATLGSDLTSPVDFLSWLQSSVDSRTANTFTVSGSGRGVYFLLPENKTSKINVSGLTGSAEIRYRTTTGGAGTVLGASDTDLYVTTTNATSNIYLRATASGTVSVTDVSIKEVNGNPAIMTNQTSSDIENGSPYANIVQNGTFDTDSNWTKGTGWSIANGLASCDGSQSSSSNLYQVLYTVGKTYKTQLTVNAINGTLKVFTGTGAASLTITSVGTYDVTTEADSSTVLYIQAQASSSMTIDNVTVEEVNTGLQGYWKMGDGTNDEYPVIYDQTNPTLGSEIVTNADFANDSDWVKDSGWTIANGKATNDGSSGQIYQELSLEIGKKYVVRGVIDASADAGLSNTAFQIRYNSNAGSITQLLSSSGQILANTINYLYLSFTATETNSLLRVYSEDSVSFYNPTVKEVQGNPATMTNMLEGNITNQYPLTKIRNYYRMGDGILDGYPLIADQTNPSLGSELVTNGDFTTDLSGWINTSTHWQWSSGSAYHPLTTSFFPLKQTLTNDLGAILKITFDLTYVQGTAQCFYKNEANSDVSTAFTSSGSYTIITEPVKANTEINFARSLGHNTEFYIDNVSVKQVNGNPGIMTNMSASDIILDTPNEPN